MNHKKGLAIFLSIAWAVYSYWEKALNIPLLLK